MRHFRDIATHFHAQARLSKKSADYEEAADWYRRFLKSFKYEQDAAEVNFLLAESLYDAGRIAAAIDEYERSAYRYSRHKNSAESGYAALLSYAVLEKSSTGEQKAELSRKRIDSALRFSEQFVDDKRVPLVLLQTAEHFFTKKQYQQASNIASRVTKHKLADRKTTQSAWSIVAHSQFSSGQFALAEKSYLSLVNFTPVNSQLHRETRELVAASIYRQGELPHSIFPGSAR